MPQFRDYLAYNTTPPEILSTDVMLVDRLGVGTVGVSIFDVVIYDIAMWYPNQLPPSAYITWFNAVRPFTLPVGLTGSLFTLGTAPASPLTLNILKNGSTIGTLFFAAGNTTPTVTFTTLTSFAVGDQLRIQTPAATYSAANLAATFLAGRIS